MKNYETTFEEYLKMNEAYNLHPELVPLFKTIPIKMSDFKNMIIYGPPGVGKYTQVLSIIQRYSPSKLKYDKKISVFNDKKMSVTKSTTSFTPALLSDKKIDNIEEVPVSECNETKNIKTENEDKNEKTTRRKTNDKPKTIKKKTNKQEDVNTEESLSKINTPTIAESSSEKKGKKGVVPSLQIKKQDKKTDFIFRISDIHYEIDMSTLGCNSKILWHEIFFQIVDIISAKSDKKGILVCKNFHMIHNELLEIFYSYMRHPLHHYNIQLKYILITEHIGFIPENIMNVCEILSVKRPSKEQYLKIGTLHPPPPLTVNKLSFDVQKIVTHTYPSNIDKIDEDTVMNMKELYSFQYIKNLNEIPVDVFHIVGDAIIQQMLNPVTLKITELRNHLYDMLIYNLDVFECIWYILKHFIDNGVFKSKGDISLVIRQTFIFLKYYNNNYRSIYHLESIILYIFNKIHYPDSNTLVSVSV
jgi:hypothetical protein